MDKFPWGTYNTENIKFLIEAITGDEYDSDAAAQQSGGAQVGGLPKDFKQLVQIHLDSSCTDSDYVLELGIGQWAYPFSQVTHAVDASEFMVNSLKNKLSCDMYDDYGVRLSSTRVFHGVVESLSPDWNDNFSAVLFLNGWFQVRSDYEAFLEVNRVLKRDGLLILNLYSDDDTDIICGRVLGPKNYIRVAEEFGFALQAWHRNVGASQGVKNNNLLVFRKIDDARVERLRKLQLVRQSDGNYKANNLDVSGRDSIYL